MALAKMLAGAPSVLCLDEPTNHLDMQSRDALEDALADYQGALILITHDRHLIRSVATRVVEVDAGRLTEHASLEDYVAARPVSPGQARRAPAADPARQRRQHAAEQRRVMKELRDAIAAVEKELEAVSARRAEIEALFSDPGAYARGADMAGLAREHAALASRVASLERDWDELTARLEGAAS